MTPMQQSQRSHFDVYKQTLATFERELSTSPRLRSDPVRLAFIDWLLRVIPAGIAAIDADPARWLPGGPMPANMVGGDTFVFSALQVNLGKHDDRDVRRLVAATCTMYADLDSVCAHLERLAGQDLDDLPWLVAGALWVEWGSGQPATLALRSALDGVRAGRADFDGQLAARIQTASGAVSDLLQIARTLLTNRAAVLPRAP